MSTARENSGFSLIETLVAALVFSVGVVGVMPLIAGAVRATRGARDTGTATWLAWQKAEELRGPAGAAAAGAGAGADHLDQFGRSVDPPGVYTRRWAVTLAGADVLRIAVGVHHASAPGAPIVLVSLRSRSTP